MMKKQVAALSVCMAAFVAFAQSPIQDSVITVQELLKIDNAQALDKATGDAIKAGLIKPKKSAIATEKEEPPLPKWTVLSIYGKQGELVADLQVDNAQSPGARAGTTVAMCKVVAVEDKCVTLVAEKPSVRKGSCNQVCWTGDELAEQLRPVQQGQGAPTAAGSTPALPKAGAALPAPLPAAAMPLPTATKP